VVVSDGDFHIFTIKLCAQIYQKIWEEIKNKRQFGSWHQIKGKLLVTIAFDVKKLLKSSIVDGVLQFADNQLTLN